MNLKHLSDEKLEQNLVTLFEKERALLCVIIQHVIEVQRRKKYLNTDDSLFAYLQKISNYTHGTTQRRIDAAMLAIEIPEILTAINAGRIKSCQIVIAQKAFRLSAKLKKQRVPKELKIKILKHIEDKSADESQVIIYSQLDIKPKMKIKTTRQADGSVRVETTFTKEQWETVETAKELLSHSVPNGNFVELVTYMGERVIAHKTKSGRAKAAEKNPQTQAAKETTRGTEATNQGVKAKASNAEKVSNQVASGKPTVAKEAAETANGISKVESQIPSGISRKRSEIPNAVFNDESHIPNGISKESKPEAPRSRGFVQNYVIKQARAHIPAETRRAVFARDKCCRHKDKTTGQICGSRWQLQTDHIQPVWAGGDNSLENLQALCAVHNRRRYQRQAGIRRV